MVRLVVQKPNVSKMLSILFFSVVILISVTILSIIPFASHIANRLRHENQSFQYSNIIKLQMGHFSYSRSLEDTNRPCLFVNGLGFTFENEKILHFLNAESYKDDLDMNEATYEKNNLKDYWGRLPHDMESKCRELIFTKFNTVNQNMSSLIKKHSDTLCSLPKETIVISHSLGNWIMAYLPCLKKFDYWFSLAAPWHAEDDPPQVLKTICGYGMQSVVDVVMNVYDSLKSFFSFLFSDGPYYTTRYDFSTRLCEPMYEWLFWENKKDTFNAISEKRSNSTTKTVFICAEFEDYINATHCTDAPFGEAIIVRGSHYTFDKQYGVDDIEGMMNEEKLGEEIKKQISPAKNTQDV